MNPTANSARIVRLWHGAVPRPQAEEYYQYLHQTGLRDYAATPGNQGLYVLRRDEAEVTHFLLVTLWESEEAVRQFAGPDFLKARYYPADAEYLLELEPLVTHYELLFQQ